MNTQFLLLLSILYYKLLDFKKVKEYGCIINGVDGRNFYQCHFLIKKN